jgi:NYN domain
MNDLSQQSGLSLSLVQKPRVAVLVDGDNIPHNQLDAIEVQARGLGEVVARHLYCDISLRKDWALETSFLTTHCTTAFGKNRADMHLIIEALDIANRRLATHFLIVSDDRDFGPLVDHLRKIGMQVVWEGKAKPVPKHIFTPTIVKKPVTIEDKIVALILSEGEAKSMPIGLLGGRMHSLHKIKIGFEPEKTWRAFLLARPKTFCCDPRSSTARVKLLHR